MRKEIIISKGESLVDTIINIPPDILKRAWIYIEDVLIDKSKMSNSQIMPCMYKEYNDKKIYFDSEVEDGYSVVWYIISDGKNIPIIKWPDKETVYIYIVSPR